MSLTLLQSLSLPGDPARVNEDAFAHAPYAAAVLDGATPLGPPLLPGPSDAAWIARFGARRLMAHLADGGAARQALAQALSETRDSFAGLARRPVRETWQTPCASMILVAEAGPDSGFPQQLDFFWFGDCTALVVQDGICQIVGDGFDRRGAEAARARRLVKEKNLSPRPDLGRPEVLDSLKANRNRINSGRNWLFSPDPRAARHVSHQAVRRAPGALLLLASDGFLALASDYGAYNAATLIAAARDRGLEALGAELRAIEEADAMAEKFARFKKSDDATALLLEVS